MSTILLDDRGELWTNAEIRLKQAFASTCPDEEVVGYLVRNMGFVAIDAYGRSCQFRLRPSTLSVRTFDSLITWLSQHRYQRFVMNWLDSEWRLELYGNSDVVVRRLLQLVDLKQSVRPGDFLAKPLSQSEVESNTAFGSLLKNWPMLAGNLHHDGLRNILSRLTNRRYFLVRLEAENQRLMYEVAGNGFTPVNNDWLAAARGLPIEQQPDPAYGRFVAAGYRQALAGQAPIFEAVDAIVDSKAAGRHRIRYNRVMLPTQAADGTRWLLGASTMDTSIDLRA